MFCCPYCGGNLKGIRPDIKDGVIINHCQTCGQFIKISACKNIEEFNKNVKNKSFWSSFKREFFPTFDEETEDLIIKKERLETLINTRIQKSYYNYELIWRYIMKKILWFNVKEPFEKLVDKILKAKNEKIKIEFTTSYIQSKLSAKQLDKFIYWMDVNKDWLKDVTIKETDFDRLRRKMPIGCNLEISSIVPLTEYIVFDFR